MTKENWKVATGNNVVQLYTKIKKIAETNLIIKKQKKLKKKKTIKQKLHTI